MDFRPGKPGDGFVGIELLALDVREKLQRPISSEFISASKHSNFENRTESAESGALERNEPFGEEWADPADQKFGA
jgi:hypothetical protein